MIFHEATREIIIKDTRILCVYCVAYLPYEITVRVCVTVHVCGFEPVNCVLGAGFSFVFFWGGVCGGGVCGGGGGGRGGRGVTEFMQTKGNHHQGHSCPLCLLYSLPTLWNHWKSVCALLCMHGFKPVNCLLESVFSFMFWVMKRWEGVGHMFLREIIFRDTHILCSYCMAYLPYYKILWEKSVCVCTHASVRY